MFIMCDDFPSVVLYLDNKSKETSSLSTPNDNDPVFCVYELRFTLKKNPEFVKKFFSGKVDNFHTLHLQFHILVFILSKSSSVLFYKRIYQVGVEMTKLCCWYCYQYFSFFKFTYIGVVLIVFFFFLYVCHR